MVTAKPHRPDQSGYQETRPTELPRAVHDRPDPEAAGGERAQVAGGAVKPDEEQEPKPVEPDPMPPGEHKHEPIKDPDPADTKLYVSQSSR